NSEFVERYVRTVIRPLPKSRSEDTAPLHLAKRMESTLLGRLAEVPGQPGESTGRKRGQNMPRTFTHGLKFIAVSALTIAVVFARADMAFAYSRPVDASYAADDGGKDKGKADKGNSNDNPKYDAKASEKAEVRAEASVKTDVKADTKTNESATGNAKSEASA